ncbi:hypothetical protein T484DRAFT_1776043, partial [Baffinella frigidus]
MVLAMAHLGSASRTHSGWDRVPASSKAVEGLEGRRRQTLRPGVLRLSGGADVLGEAAGGLQDLYMSCRFGSASSGVAAAASYARGCFGSISSGETGHPLWQGALAIGLRVAVALVVQKLGDAVSQPHARGRGAALSGRSALALGAVPEQDVCMSEDDVASSCSVAGDTGAPGLNSDWATVADAAQGAGGAWDVAGEESGVAGESGEFRDGSAGEERRAEIAGLLEGGGFGGEWMPPDEAALLLENEGVGVDTDGHGG